MAPRIEYVGPEPMCPKGQVANEDYVDDSSDNDSHDSNNNANKW